MARILAGLFYLTVALGWCVATAHAVAIEWVSVDDLGNACDTQSQGCFGAVSYSYLISKYEITNAQYAEFLNAVAAVGDPHGLYDTNMGGGWNDTGGISRTGSGTGADPWVYAARPNRGNRPVNYVSWYDALRFANWMHNGQGSGDTEDGAYDMSLGASVVRKPGALVFLPSEDEWYKAAYYKGGGTHAGYWDYPTETNDPNPPTAEAPPGTDTTYGSANYYDGGYVDTTYYTTEVGAYNTEYPPGTYVSDSAYGTFDQGGNVKEWNETDLFGDTSTRGFRGGSFYNFDYVLNAAFRNGVGPTGTHYDLGFRVASSLKEIQCNDSLDNDSDGDTDCDDTDCQGVAGCPEIQCNDSLDNDSDGDTDCYDTDCPCAVYSLTGSARLQIGGGLPIPIGATPPPNGRIGAIPGAVVFQTAGPDPKQLTIPRAQLQNAVYPVRVGRFAQNPALFQVQTSIGIKFPGTGTSGGVFQAGGRTGPATVTFCMGWTAPLPTNNPACPSAMAGSPIKGLMRYTKTAAQFGGPAQHAATGMANIAFVIGTKNPPCAGLGCTAQFAYANLAPSGGQGAPFGFQNTSPGWPPTPNGIAVVSANAAGSILNVTSASLGRGFTNMATSFGGPWTTGRLTVQVTNALGGLQTYIFSGMDSRVGGLGPISLVSGAITTRARSGPNTARGWLNLSVGLRVPPVPALSGPGLAAAFGLLALAGAHLLRRRFRSRRAH